LDIILIFHILDLVSQSSNMKTKLVQIFYLLIVVFLWYGSHAQEKKSITLEFNKSEFTFEKNQTLSIKTTNLDYIFPDKPGYPKLPFQIVNVVVPYNSVYHKISCKVEKSILYSEISLENTRPFIPTGAISTPDLQPYDQDSLNLSDPYPEKNALYTSTQKCSQYKFFTFLICPFEYHYEENKLYFISEIQLDIYYDEMDDNEGYRWDNGLFKDMLSSELINSDELESFDIQNLRNGENISHIIITADSLLNAFDTLAGWKIQKGVRCEVISIDSIYANYSGSTNQLKIKECIYDYYQNKGTQWVLLGGDCEIVPDQDCYVQNSPQGSPGYLVSYYMPTDLFYACFDNQFDWNSDADTLVGEVGDNIDMAPEVILTRAPVKNIVDVNAVTAKTLSYEKDPPLNDFAEEMLLSGVKLFSYYSGISDAEIKTEKMWTDYIEPYWDGRRVKFYDTNTDMFGGKDYDVVVNHFGDVFSQGYNFFNIHTHGSSIGWTMERQAAFCYYNADLFTNLNNQGIITTPACDVNAFDYYFSDCLSEGLYLSPTGGCVGFIGSSREGFGTYGTEHGPSQLYVDNFYQYLFNGSPAEHSYKFGAVMAQAKIHYIGASTEYNCYRWLQFALNTIGEPEFDVYTSDPDQLFVEGPELIPSGRSSSISIFTSHPNAKICLTVSDSIYITGQSDSTGRFTFTPPPVNTDSILITATCHNTIYDTNYMAVTDAAVPILIISSIDIDAEGNDTISLNDTVSILPTIKNIGSVSVTGINISMLFDDPYIDLVDSVLTCGTLNAGDSIVPADPLVFVVKGDIPNAYNLNSKIKIIGDRSEQTQVIPLGLQEFCVYQSPWFVGLWYMIPVPIIPYMR